MSDNDDNDEKKPLINPWKLLKKVDSVKIPVNKNVKKIKMKH